MNTKGDVATVATESWKLIKDQRRKQLIYLSEEAREIRDEEGLDCTLNSIIIERFYTRGHHNTFKSFKGWKKEGYSVIKGSEAFVVWGRKRIVEEAKDHRESEESEEAKKYKYFPLAYLFSNQQVKT